MRIFGHSDLTGWRTLADLFWVSEIGATRTFEETYGRWNLFEPYFGKPKIGFVGEASLAPYLVRTS